VSNNGIGVSAILCIIKEKKSHGKHHRTAKLGLIIHQQQPHR